MRLSSHEPPIRRSLRQLAHHTPRTTAPSFSSRRHFSVTPQHHDPPRRVAILGGGITGLASAHYLSRADPAAHITLYEASDRLGGWMHSRHVDVEGGRILFESGPRTLRPSGNGLVTAKLLEDLDLKDDVVFVSKRSEAARYRYIYWPDRLRRMPSPGEGIIGGLANLWGNRDLFQGLWSGAWRDITEKVEPAKGADESIGDFIARRFDRHLADNVASAVFHGIYAGDIYNLSVKSLVPFLPYLEQKYGSVMTGTAAIASGGRKIMERRLWDVAQAEEMTKMDLGIYQSMKGCSVFTLLGGLGQFTTRLEEVLGQNENVTFKRGTPVTKLEKKAEDNALTLTHDGGNDADTYDSVISTLSHNKLADLIITTPNSTPVYKQPTVSVMLVNLYFPNPALLKNSPGFGYLLPRSVPYTQNPECALGVVFDSYAAPGQDTASGTKLTVMLGGHWWNSFPAESLPGEEEGLWMARSVLARHLGIVDEPTASQVKVQRECIPQYVVGHQRRMGDFHSRLLRDFGGRLRVAGSSYGGVGVNDCVRGAWDLGEEVRKKGWTGPVTGLERCANDKLDIVELSVAGGEWQPSDRK